MQLTKACKAAWLLSFVAKAFNLRSSSRTDLNGGDEDDQWQACAVEGDVVQLEGMVRFGWGESWVQAPLPRGASCALASFGNDDPAPGIRKVCECMPPSQTATPNNAMVELGTSWTRCANEGDSCACPSGEVRFGATNRWVAAETAGPQAKVAAPSVTCQSTSFGNADPASGINKECWCMLGRSGKPPVNKVAIVMLSRNPPDFEAWLRYHLGYMQVEHVFVQVEDTPWLSEGAPFWSSLPSGYEERVTLWRVAPQSLAQSDSRPADDYETLQARQLRAMSQAKAKCQEMGIDWLIHIDDDELLHAPVHRPVGEILAAMPANFDQAYMPNVEAVYQDAGVKHCFAETQEVNMNRYKFVSYANGKAVVRVKSSNGVEIRPAGPHQWRTMDNREPSSIHLDQEPFGAPLMVVHFESCPMVRWEDKFWELGNTSPERVNRIPFKFYRESIQRMQHCRKTGAALAAGTAECSQDALLKLWESWKTVHDKDLRPEDLMPLRIPWASILSQP
eukprot:TRINITY_DN92449_c0_g1_i1.p1 TRINITY_DN92449_c0_g1~~TRINITY_DN92449_c0_g1_i1.p1  ORF type:complete len:506 (+),score=108.88 TRINITY_DN92449_c0_g1_i1:92-1609(+)